MATTTTGRDRGSGGGRGFTVDPAPEAERVHDRGVHGGPFPAELEQDHARGPLRVAGAALHPLAVTVPIGALVCAFLFDLASLWVEAEVYARGAMWLSIIGLAGALLAAVGGLADAGRRTLRGTPARHLAMRHLLLNGLVVVLVAVALGSRRTSLDTLATDGSPVAAVVLSGLAVAVLVVSGTVGGNLAGRLDRGADGGTA